MKHGRIFFLALAILIALMPVVALASGALWRGEVRVTNNGTSTANNVTATVNISSQGLIDNGYATANLSDVAIECNGTDVAFMPSVNSSYPWAVFVDSIGAGLNVVYDLFTGGAPSGLIRYFPGPAGMTSDNFSIGDNFTIEQKGWVDTTAGANKNLVFKKGAFRTYISNAENITSAIADDTAFPTVAAINGGNDVVNATSHTVNLPTGIASGNLLIVLFAADETPTITFPDGWTQLFQVANSTLVKFGAWYRITDGTEGSTITVTTSNAQMTAHTSRRITGYIGVPEVGTSVTGTSVSPNPPDLAPTWETDNTLWIAVQGNNAATTTDNYPANYTNGRKDSANNAEGCGVGSAGRNLAAASENPNAFTLNNSQAWVANTIAIEGFVNLVEVTASGVSSGNHTVKTEANELFFGIGVDQTNSASWPITDGLIFNAPLWHNELDGSPFTTKDSNAHSCTVTGATWNYATGRTFTAGTGDLINCGSDASLEITNQIAVEAWVYPTGYGDLNFGRVYEGRGGLYRLFFNAASPRLKFDIEFAGIGGVGISTNTNSVPLNTWTHFFGTYDGAVMKTFINGVQQTETYDIVMAMAALGANNLYLGNQVGGARTWAGRIAEFRVYNSIPSPTEILAQYNATKWKYNGSASYIPYQLVGTGVRDNANDWNFLQNGSMPYMEYQKIWVDGVLQQHIVWQYDTTFQDLSAGNHDAIPTFRTDASDNILASLISFSPVTESKMPTFTLTASYEILTGTPSMPSGMFEGGSYSKLPSAPINEILDEAGVPRAAWWDPFIFMGICVIGFIVYGATTMIRGPSGRLHEGQIDGSLLLMFIVMEVLLVVFGKMGVLLLWPAYLFPISGISLILSKKHYAWG